MELDDDICLCFHVSKRKILNYLRIHKPRRASQLSECGGAGTGCGWCVAYLKRYFNDLQKGDHDVDKDLTSEDYAAGRSQHISKGNGTPPQP